MSSKVRACAPKNLLRCVKVRHWLIFGRTQQDDADPHEENPIPRLGAYVMGKHLPLDLATSETHGGNALPFFTRVCRRQS